MPFGEKVVGKYRLFVCKIENNISTLVNLLKELSRTKDNSEQLLFLLLYITCTVLRCRLDETLPITETGPESPVKARQEFIHMVTTPGEWV